MSTPRQSRSSPADPPRQPPNHAELAAEPEPTPEPTPEPAHAGARVAPEPVSAAPKRRKRGRVVAPAGPPRALAGDTDGAPSSGWLPSSPEPCGIPVDDLPVCRTTAGLVGEAPCR